MTDEQFERAIEFLLESQASLTARVETLSVEAEADRRVMRAAIGEMHEGINAMLTIAERLTNNSLEAGKVQQGTTQRVERLEDRVKRIEDQLEQG